jgi:hypothetical protein
VGSRDDLGTVAKRIDPFIIPAGNWTPVILSEASTYTANYYTDFKLMGEEQTDWRNSVLLCATLFN